MVDGRKYYFTGVESKGHARPLSLSLRVYVSERATDCECVCKYAVWFASVAADTWIIDERPCLLCAAERMPLTRLFQPFGSSGFAQFDTSCQHFTSIVGSRINTL